MCCSVWPKEVFDAARSHGVFGSTLLSILCVSVFLVVFLKNVFIGIREREIDQLGAPCRHPDQDQTRNLGMFPDWESNPWSFSAQDDTQPTEPHRLGPRLLMAVEYFINWTFPNWFLQFCYWTIHFFLIVLLQIFLCWATLIGFTFYWNIFSTEVLFLNLFSSRMFSQVYFFAPPHTLFSYFLKNR